MSEHAEQSALMEWAAYHAGRYPELVLLYAIPNGGHRHKAVAAKLSAEGVKSGVPDLHLPVARCGFHGCYIEMKFGKNSTTDNQKWWLGALANEGYYVTVCWTWEAARDVLTNYLEGALSTSP